jgi:hypothetical protein
MTTPAMPSPEIFFAETFAFQRTAAMKAAIELELFTAIDEGATASTPLPRDARPVNAASASSATS